MLIFALKMLIKIVLIKIVKIATLILRHVLFAKKVFG